MMFSRTLAALGLGAFVSVSMVAPSMAQNVVSAGVQPQGMVILAADGCGPGWYRGPGGACHPFGTGPFPGGYFGPYGGGYWAPRPVYAAPSYTWNGCAPGYWRGPWGHCRNTPYHGRLPNGMWQ